MFKRKKKQPPLQYRVMVYEKAGYGHEIQDYVCVAVVDSYAAAVERLEAELDTQYPHCWFFNPRDQEFQFYGKRDKLAGYVQSYRT